MNTRFAAGVLVGAASILMIGWWVPPKRKAQLESQVHYTWHTGSERRVDLGIQESGFILYVGNKDQTAQFFQLIVLDDEIATYHSLDSRSSTDGKERGVNLDSKAGKITKFIAALGDDHHTLLSDTNGDLRFDRMLSFSPTERRNIDWSYSTPEEPNKAPEPTPGAVTPRATEGVSR